jgi:hypothetical protein
MGTFGSFHYLKASIKRKENIYTRSLNPKRGTLTTNIILLNGAKWDTIVTLERHGK